MHSLSFGYDGALPTTETWSGDAGLVSGSVGRGYDDHFRVDEHDVNGAAVAQYGYDQDNLLTSAGPMTITRQPDNGLLSGTTLGAITTTQTQTSFGELDDLSATYSNQLVYEEDVTDRDERGRISARTESIAATDGALEVKTYDYGYDAAARLRDVFINGDQVSHYDYDPNGNRTTHVTAAGAVTGRYDDQDRLTRYCPEDGNGNPQPSANLPCFAYTYRVTGELQTKTDLLTAQQTTYDYDELGALRAVQLPDGRLIEYEIDAAGRRVGKYMDGIKQWGLLYQNELRPIAELDADNNIVATFVYGTMPNVPDYMLRDGAVYRS